MSSDADADMQMEAFLTLHNDLPREGPGEAADIRWAAEVAVTPANAQIADVGCGPGADIGTWLEVAPKGHVTALDKIPQFVSAARATWGEDPRVTILKADMARIQNQYDIIWCAGAVYFLGVSNALTTWRKSLTPGGVIAFSEICWFSDAPAQAAKDFWQSYPAMTNEAGIQSHVEEAGYETVATRRLSDAAWEAYFGPIDARIKALRPDASAELNAVLDEAEQEADCWRAHRADFGYLLSVVRRK